MSILHQGFQIGFVKCFDSSCERAIAEHENRGAVFTCDPGGLQGNIKAIFDGGGRENNPRTVAVAPEDGLIEVALFDICRQPRTWTPALDVDNNQRNFRY